MPIVIGSEKFMAVIYHTNGCESRCVTKSLQSAEIELTPSVSQGLCQHKQSGVLFAELI